jgi:hypothetical protein
MPSGKLSGGPQVDGTDFPSLSTSRQGPWIDCVNRKEVTLAR